MWRRAGVSHLLRRSDIAAAVQPIQRRSGHRNGGLTMFGCLPFWLDASGNNWE